MEWMDKTNWSIRELQSLYGVSSVTARRYHLFATLAQRYGIDLRVRHAHHRCGRKTFDTLLASYGHPSAQLLPSDVKEEPLASSSTSSYSKTEKKRQVRAGTCSTVYRWANECQYDITTLTRRYGMGRNTAQRYVQFVKRACAQGIPLLMEPYSTFSSGAQGFRLCLETFRLSQERTTSQQDCTTHVSSSSSSISSYSSTSSSLSSPLSYSLFSSSSSSSPSSSSSSSSLSPSSGALSSSKTVKRQIESLTCYRVYQLVNECEYNAAALSRQYGIGRGTASFYVRFVKDASIKGIPLWEEPFASFPSGAHGFHSCFKVHQEEYPHTHDED